MFGRSPRTGNLVGPGGTGFLVSRHSTALPRTWHMHAVTDRRVVQNCSCIRVNTKAGGIRFVELEPTDWAWAARDDLAIADVTGELDLDMETGPYSDELSCVDEMNFVSRDFHDAYNIGIGDQTIVLGLFVDHAGGRKNVPVGRFGDIAAAPSGSFHVKLASVDPMAGPAYPNDMRSRTGLSGSPVWVWRTPYDDMNSFKTGRGFLPSLMGTERPFLASPGVHRGQFPEGTRLMAAEAPALKAGQTVYLASAMTVAVPAWEITALLDKTPFEDRRNERDKRPGRTASSGKWLLFFRGHEERSRGA